MKVTNVLVIDWDKVNPKYRFAGMNSIGMVLLFTERPKKLVFGWGRRSTLDLCIRYITEGESILKDRINWKKTLTARPVKVE